jgi:CheY-like chemotaxis protein
MIVDDSQIVLKVEEMMLKGAGYHVVKASNGVEALEMVVADPPDLIFMDVNMPMLNGIDTCRILKNDPSTRSIKIVMLTTKGEQESVERAFNARCDDYLTKPMTKMALIAKVRQFEVDSYLSEETDSIRRDFHVVQ